MKQQDHNATIVIFGAYDLEEQAARELCQLYGISTGTATYKGKPVNYDNVYLADGHRLDTYNVNPNHQTIEYPEKVIIFECNPNCVNNYPIAGICDHHNPGDFGYGLGPDQFWEASSIGQLVKTLDLRDIEGREDLLMTAAADHCLADAYAGRCPGIDPKRFAQFRETQIWKDEVKRQKIESDLERQALVRDIYDDIRQAMIKIIAEEMGVSPVEGVVDVRHCGEVPQLPEAALRTGHAYLAEIPERDRNGEKTGRRKVVLGGHTTPKQVEEFLAWARSLGNRVGEPYGNPTRGYAGVILGDKRCPTCGVGYFIHWYYTTCPHCQTPYPRMA